MICLLRAVRQPWPYVKVKGARSLDVRVGVYNGRASLSGSTERFQEEENVSAIPSLVLTTQDWLYDGQE
jgi:hypothetical protein